MQVIDGGPLTPPALVPVQRFWQQKGPGGFWQTMDCGPFDEWNWARCQEEVGALAAGLITLGIRPGDVVGLMAETSRWWRISELAIVSTGAAVIPLYPSLLEDQVSHILADAQARLVLAEEALANRIPATYDTILASECEALQAEGRKALRNEPTLVSARLDAIQFSHLATIFYTSGTTGVPKGVPLTHGHWANSTHANVYGLGLNRIKDASMLAFLPMAHVAGYASVLAITELNGVVAFSRPHKMVADLQELQPTLLVAVPRLYERILRKVADAVAATGGTKARLFHWAKDIAIQVGKAREGSGRCSPWLAMKFMVADRLVLSKLRATLGFNRVKMGLTGAAAVRPEILWFMQGAGINVIEAYGLTESAGLVVSNRFADYRSGSVGIPMAGTKAALAEDGEILLAGPTIFPGYLNLPEETARSLVQRDGETWLATGDIGRLDADGYISIIDRKKELEVLDTGKMIAPMRVEELMKEVCPFVEDAVLIGTDRPFATMLIQPAFDDLELWVSQHGSKWTDMDVVREADPTGQIRISSVREPLLQDLGVQELYANAVSHLNERLADYERVRRFALLPVAFRQDTQELTPTLKKRRKAILARHEARVEKLYA